MIEFKGEKTKKKNGEPYTKLIILEAQNKKHKAMVQYS